MAADWPGHRAGNDKIVLAAEGIGSKRATQDLEQPFHTMPIRRSGKLAPHPLGEGAEVIFDIFPGQRLRPGAQRHLAQEGRPARPISSWSSIKTPCSGT